MARRAEFCSAPPRTRLLLLLPQCAPGLRVIRSAAANNIPRACPVHLSAAYRNGVECSSSTESGSGADGMRRLCELPDYTGPSRLLKAAHKARMMVKPNAKLANANKRAVKHACVSVDTYTQTLSVALREQQRGLKAHLAGLHPFERSLAELTLQARLVCFAPSPPCTHALLHAVLLISPHLRLGTGARRLAVTLFGPQRF